MRILMLARDNSLQGGINRHILAIAPAINGVEGCEVAVCTTSPIGELNETLTKAGVRTYALGLPHGHSLRTWRRFRRVMRDFRPDVVHAHSMSIMVRIYLGLFCRKVPIVVTCHVLSDSDSGVRKKTWRDRLDALADKILPGRPRKTVFISRGVADAYGCPSGTVVYNPVRFDEGSFSCRKNNLREELGLPSDVPLIGTSCRIAPVKRPLVFVRVMCDVLKVIPRAHAVVCGTSQDPALMRELMCMVDESGVGARFHWLGYRSDAAKITAELDCFVMTSATEGMPTALLEAMSAKTPIAFMRGKGGLVDLDELNNSEGPFAVVVDADDVEGLTREIGQLLEHPDEAKRRAAHAFDVGARHFNVEDVKPQLVEIYRRLLSQRLRQGVGLHV